MIESVLTPEKYAKFLAAFLSGTEMTDTLFQTWKFYHARCMAPTRPFSVTAERVLDEVLPMPNMDKKECPNQKRNVTDNFFIISADNVFLEKMSMEEEKKRKIDEKEQ